MRYRLLVLAGLIGLGVVSCGGDTTPSSADGPPTGSLKAAAGPGPALPPPPGGAIAAPAPSEVRQTYVASNGLTAFAPAAAPASTMSDVPVPPRDAQWTMLCYTVPGPDHINLAKDIKDYFARKSKRKEWYVI